MTLEEFKKEFLAFLEEEGVREAFEGNLRDPEVNMAYDEFSGLGEFMEALYESEFSLEDALMIAFVWKNTEQGHEFWKSLSERWEERLLKAQEEKEVSR